MSHATYMRGNWVDSRLLVLGSQIANLTPGLFLGHNLCFRCPNGQCELISDIYISVTFQYYKEIFEPMGFDPCNCALKIWESIWDFNFQHGSSLESVRVHSLTLFAFPRACDVSPKSLSWPATLQPLALVTNPRLGLRHIVWSFLKWFKNVVHIENYGKSDNKCACNKIPPINNKLVENDKLIYKVNIVENQIVKPTLP
jgi:hypothetical protein